MLGKRDYMNKNCDAIQGNKLFALLDCASSFVSYQTSLFRLSFMTKQINNRRGLILTTLRRSVQRVAETISVV